MGGHTGQVLFVQHIVDRHPQSPELPAGIAVCGQAVGCGDAMYVPADPFHGIEDLPDKKDIQQGQKKDIEANQAQDKTVYNQYTGTFRLVPKQTGEKSPEQGNTKNGKKDQTTA
jgi:hypothetical protein